VLERFPDGIDRSGFIQKAVGAHYPAWIERIKVKKAVGTVTHALCEDAATLKYLANQACVTFHTQLRGTLAPADLPGTFAGAAGPLARAHGDYFSIRIP
jgi:DNA primase